MFGLHTAASSQLSFREARQINLSPLHPYCIYIGRTVSKAMLMQTRASLCQESHGYDVLFPSLFDDEGNLL